MKLEAGLGLASGVVAETVAGREASTNHLVVVGQLEEVRSS